MEEHMARKPLVSIEQISLTSITHLDGSLGLPFPVINCSYDMLVSVHFPHFFSQLVKLRRVHARLYSEPYQIGIPHGKRLDSLAFSI